MSERTYYLETFGCQMNVLDSQLVAGQLCALGLRSVAAMRDADVILFNTCSVRKHAEDKVLSRLGQLKGVKRKRPEAVIGVIGCMAEREKEGIFAKAPHVDLLCGPGELDRLPGLLNEVWDRHERVAALAGSLSRRTEVLARALEYDSLEALDMSRSAALDAAADAATRGGGADAASVLQSYIRVQRGCDKFCTYCVVPFTRGPERSRPPQHIVDEARMLAERGCREVTLLGQTVNSYMHQEDGCAVPFAKLLERVHEVDGIDRIRFVTSFPADWDEDIFRVMRDYPKVCPYLHIPAQSGSDAVLKRMRRTYTAAEYLRLMDTARRYIPDISLAGDIIVGFCGETDADFAATIDLVRRVEYKSLFVFKYSPRPGTAADRHQADDVPYDVKQRRNNELLAVQAEISARHKQRLIGQTVDVLVEGFSKYGRRNEAAKGRGHEGTNRRADERAGDASAEPLAIENSTSTSMNRTWQESEQDRGCEVLAGPAGAAPNGNGEPAAGGQLVGRTPGDLIVVFDGDASMIGSLTRVRIERTTALTLFGRVEAVASPARRCVQRPHSGNGISLPVL